MVTTADTGRKPDAPGSPHIARRADRWLVRLADAALWPLGFMSRSPRPGTIGRILLLRLERIGDLLMTTDAISRARATWPSAEIDLAVGAWNLALARLIPGVTRVEVMTVPWLARDGEGQSATQIVAQARSWRQRGYDLGLNFEPDIRSNGLLWLAGPAIRVGYDSGGGGSFLTSAAPYDATAHVTTNACRLIERAAHLTGTTMPSSRGSGTSPRLRTPAPDHPVDDRILHAGRPLVGMHVAGGRQSKQWHVDRFAEVASRLAAESGATIVLTGTTADRPLVDAVRRQMAADTAVIDVAGTTDLVHLARMLGQLDVLVTGDTGPMHLAAAVGTPVVALFGPSDPTRYGPRATSERILVADQVPCRPCGQVRLPPERCRGHVPDCMDGLTIGIVVEAVRDILRERAGTETAGRG